MSFIDNKTGSLAELGYDNLIFGDGSLIVSKNLVEIDRRDGNSINSKIPHTING